jgi:head-tail adaptor
MAGINGLGIGQMRPWSRHHLVTLQSPAVVVETGNAGGYTETWSDLSPATSWASIRGGEGDTENVTAGIERSSASHTVEIDYHAQVTLKSRVVFGSRHLYVRGIDNVDERNITMILTCEEIA